MIDTLAFHRIMIIMRVLHVISGISRAAGGPSRSVQGLVAGLNVAGVETWLMTLNHGVEPWIEGVTRFENGGVFEEVVQRVGPDIVHLQGIWSMALHRCAVVCRRLGIKYVIAPRGMLEPWSLQQKWLKKRIARWLYQDKDLKCAAALHATAESEAEQIRCLGFKNPIIVSPNGVNVPKESLAVSRRNRRLSVARDSSEPSRAAASAESLVGDGKRRVLFVSRMHPKKGVMELVEAWSKLSSASSVCSVVKDWRCELVYTVNGDFEREYEAKVKAKVKESGLEDQFIFTGALNDDEKWQAYARADLFVLPTYSENFGIVVAEALYAGVPVITTKGTPWGELDTAKCGKWIDLPTEGSNPSAWPVLVAALREMMSLSDDERHQMGANGQRLVEEKYTWDAVVKAMVKGYEEVLHGKT